MWSDVSNACPIPLERRERGGDGRRELGERTREKGKDRAERRGRKRGGEKRMRMTILRFLAKIPQRVGKTMPWKPVMDRTPFCTLTRSTYSNIWKAYRPCALIEADNALALSNIYSTTFNTHQMVRDCAASASSLLDFTRRHFVAITLHAETNFIGDLFFIFAAFYVKTPLSGLFVKGSAQEESLGGRRGCLGGY